MVDFLLCCFEVHVYLCIAVSPRTSLCGHEKLTGIWTSAGSFTLAVFSVSKCMSLRPMLSWEINRHRKYIMPQYKPEMINIHRISTCIHGIVSLTPFASLQPWVVTVPPLCFNVGMSFTWWIWSKQIYLNMPSIHQASFHILLLNLILQFSADG